MATASAVLIVRVVPPYLSSSSSIQPYLKLKASMQNIPPINNNVPINIPHPQKWTIPLNYSFLPTSLPADSQFSPLNEEMDIKYENEMKSVKHLLRERAKNNSDPLESLNMIDAIQRLGIDHCFKEEIEAILQYQYTIMPTQCFDTKCSLHEVALRFRLLRQRGYFVLSDVFGSFMNKEGELNKKVSEDMEGLTSLYEASQLCFPGEETLEKIGKFSGQILKTQMENPDNGTAKHVGDALANPFHKSLGRLMVKNYFGFPATHNKWISVFQQLAKLDFNRVQKLYQREISQLFLWWKMTGLSEEIKFGRDQPLKWYVCSLAFLADPKFSEERVELSKSLSFIYLIDDIYDLYGSIEELRLFTKAIQRWYLAAIHGLPHPMKICFIKLYETTNELSHMFSLKHGWNPIHSLQKSWASLCEAFLVEAEWFASNHFPSAKEYLENGMVSSGVHVVLAHIFFLLGQGINNKTVQLLDTNPGIVSSTASILRLSDDLGSAKDENQEGYDGSYIKYYMNENPEISVDSARQRIIHMISDAWTRLNQESLSPNPFPETFIQASQNIARFVPLLYWLR